MKIATFLLLLISAFPLSGWGQDTTDGGKDVTLTPKNLNDGLTKLTNVIVGMTEKRRTHSAKIRSLKENRGGQTPSREFPPIEDEIQDLVDLEQQYRGKRIGGHAITYLCLIASRYSGTERPIHKALDKVLEHLHEYGQLREIAIGLERLVEYEGMQTLPSLGRLIDSNEVSAFVRESARLCRARWKLRMIHNRNIWEQHLQTLNEASEINRVKERLERNFPPAKEVVLWKKQALLELDELAEKASGERLIAVKAIAPKGIVLVEDKERTQNRPLISQLASGISFRSKYLTLGVSGPKLEVNLADGNSWSLREQGEKIVIVQFSFKGCGPCEQQYPKLREIASDYPDQVSILSIMADDTIETTRESVVSGKVTWNVAWDGKDGPLASKWGVQVFPTVFIFGTDHKMVFSGGIAVKDLEKVIDALLTQKTRTK